MDEILWCYHSNEASSAVLSHGPIWFSAFFQKEPYLEILWIHKLFLDFPPKNTPFVDFWIEPVLGVKMLNHYMKEDHPSYRCIFCSYKKKAWKIHACTGVLNQVAVHDQINDHVTRELPLNSTPAAHSLKDQHSS